MVGLERWHNQRVQALRKRQQLVTASQVERSTIPVTVRRDEEFVEVDVPIPELVQEGVRAGEEADLAREDAIAAGEAADEALTAANTAATDALTAKQTADGRNRIYAQPINPVTPPELPFVNGDLWYRTEDVGGQTRFAEVLMWNGSAWKPYQLVASSLLVPGSIGSILIGDDQITGPKIATDALNFKTALGMTLTSSTIRTAATGQRLQLDTAGLRAFNSFGAVTASIASASGGFDLTGWIRAGVGGADPFEVYIEPGYMRAEGADKLTVAGLQYLGQSKSETVRGTTTHRFTGSHPLGGTVSRETVIKPEGIVTPSLTVGGDTDWVVVTPQAGGGELRWKCKNGLVEIRWIGVNGSYGTGATDLKTNFIPVEYRPNGNIRGTGALNGNVSAALYVGPTGTVGVLNSTGGPRTGGEGQCFYYL